MFLLTLLAGLVFLSKTQAFAVTKGSPCEDDCALGIFEGWQNFTCSDDEYSSTDKGRAMKACIQCESSSTAFTSSLDNDIYWYLFNMKYVAQTCLFDTTSATTALPTCEDACSDIKPVLKTLWLSKPQSSQYDYCSIHSGAFVSDADKCASCLRSVAGSVILGNFLYAMNANCESKPDASKDETGIVPDDLFNINVVATGSSGTNSEPSSTAQSQSETSASQSSSPQSSDLAASTTEPADSSSSTPTSTADSSPSSARASGTAVADITTPVSTPTPSPSDNNGTSTGSSLSSSAAAGIGAACGALGVALIASLFFLWRRRQQRRPQKRDPAWLQNSGYTKPEMDSTTVSRPQYPHQWQEMHGSEAGGFTASPREELGGRQVLELPTTTAGDRHR